MIRFFKYSFLLAFMTVACFLSFAQTPQVPATIYFADLTLKLNEQARREIQLDVDALYRNPDYFQIKLDRVNLHMPVVERVLRENGVPEDLKYLVIQESSLIADAVSTSNAVGYWQFKKGTAEEVFMRVDNQIDDRKNIVASTKGAALYLKKHQSHLDNWMCALVSYQMGLGGARGYFKDKYKGQKTIQIDRNTYWYFKKYLAHKIAFENQTGKLVSNGTYLQTYPVKGPATLAELAKNWGVSEKHLREQNKWTSDGRIPADRTYHVSFIQDGSGVPRPVLASNENRGLDNQQVRIQRQNARGYPKVTGSPNATRNRDALKVNGIKAFYANNTGTLEAYSQKTGVRERKIRRVNDLKKTDKIQAGNYYYVKRKKGKAEVEEHIVRSGESLWQIAQLYGIRLHSLKAKNRIYQDKDLKPGMVLKLQGYRKRNEEIAIVRTAMPVVQNTETSQSTGTVPATQAAQTSKPVSPESVSVSGGFTEYIVQKGDTLYAISKKHNVTIEELRNWNKLELNSVLSIGQKIIIKK